MRKWSMPIGYEEKLMADMKSGFAFPIGLTDYDIEKRIVQVRCNKCKMRHMALAPKAWKTKDLKKAAYKCGYRDCDSMKAQIEKEWQKRDVPRRS